MRLTKTGADYVLNLVYLSVIEDFTCTAVDNGASGVVSLYNSAEQLIAFDTGRFEPSSATTGNS